MGIQKKVIAKQREEEWWTKELILETKRNKEHSENS